MTTDAVLICWETRAFLAVLRENISRNIYLSIYLSTYAKCQEMSPQLDYSILGVKIDMGRKRF